MPVGKDEDILVHRVHMEGGIMFHDLEIQGGHVIRASQGPPGVSALDGMYHPYDIPPYLSCDLPETLHDSDLSSKTNRFQDLTLFLR
jgi:hypothetical protein